MLKYILFILFVKKNKKKSDKRNTSKSKAKKWKAKKPVEPHSFGMLKLE
jgi:hypothetical protein